MNAEEVKALARSMFQEMHGCTPEEYKAEQRKQREAYEAENSRTQKHIVETELSLTGDDYRKKAAHVIEGDKFQGAGLPLARYVRCLAAAKCRGIPAKDFAIKAWGDRWLADDFDRAEKVLQTNIDTAGGFIVPDSYSASLIPLLRNATMVRRSGVPTVPLRGGSMTMPKHTGAGSAAYLGEAQAIVPSEQTFGQIQLVGHKLAALTAISNDLLRESDPAADRIVRDDLVNVIALAEDSSFLRGTGSAFAPQGLRNWVNTSNVFATAGTSLDNKTTDLFQAMLVVEQSNVRLIRPVWYMSIRTKSGLMRQRDANGNFVFLDEMRRGELLGYPFFASAQVPINLGAGTESEIYFFETSEGIIADAVNLEIDVQPNGTYTTAGGVVVSGMSNDLTPIRAIKKHDFALMHDLAAAVVTAVLY